MHPPFKWRLTCYSSVKSNSAITRYLPSGRTAKLPSEDCTAVKSTRRLGLYPDVTFDEQDLVLSGAIPVIGKLPLGYRDILSEKMNFCCQFLMITVVRCAYLRLDNRSARREDNVL